jgi:4-hydroxy-3-methylbut-2-enyl diphosphate reductase
VTGPVLTAVPEGTGIDGETRSSTVRLGDHGQATLPGALRGLVVVGFDGTDPVPLAIPAPTPVRTVADVEVLARRVVERLRPADTTAGPADATRPGPVAVVALVEAAVPPTVWAGPAGAVLVGTLRRSQVPVVLDLAEPGRVPSGAGSLADGGRAPDGAAGVALSLAERAVTTSLGVSGGDRPMVVVTCSVVGDGIVGGRVVEGSAAVGPVVGDGSSDGGIVDDGSADGGIVDGPVVGDAAVGARWWSALPDPLRTVLGEWAASVRSRQVMLAAPRSFCAGVERAIEIVERAVARAEGRPVYVRRQIVHNTHVVRDLEERGAVFVQELDEVPDGATVVLAAHGVAPSVRRQAEDRRLDVVDATCPLVAKVHREARRFASEGRRIVLVGHAEHEEVEGTVGEAPDQVHVVPDVAAVERLPLVDDTPVAYLTQTTLAIDETAEVVAALQRRFTDLVGPAADDICYATQNRQDAVRAIASHCDLVLVVGSANSSNTQRLVEVVRRSGCRAELVEDVGELQLGWLTDATVVGVTAGASAPDVLVRQVVAAVGTVGPTTVEERRTTEERVRFTLPSAVR